MRIEDRRIEKPNKGDLYRRYVNSDLEECPYCGSCKIDVVDRHPNGENNFSLQMWCKDCYAEWADVCRVEYIYETIGPDPTQIV